jgi:uncharacterized protein (DUF983 family)
MTAERLPSTVADRGLAPRWRLTCPGCGAVRMVRGWPNSIRPDRQCAQCAQATRAAEAR